jgi:ParB-like chromosome segregation protein Spo0J
VEQLVGLRGHWPPILVGRADGRVIDGVHRVAAARLLGLDRIDASFFDGGLDEALIEFVRRNVYHGLPLTLRERKRAAGRVLLAHPEWSDRRIAELCAISPKTMGRLRRNLAESPAGEVAHLDVSSRIGRDNKSRPVNAALLRRRVVEAIQEQPGASLRTIAASVGVSPETVRRVRMNMSRPSVAQATRPPDPPKEAPRRQDLPLPSCEQQRDFAAWFDRTSVNEDDSRRRIGTIPLDRVREIAEEARRRSEVWKGFAQCLEQRTRKRTRPSLKKRAT